METFFFVTLSTLLLLLPVTYWWAVRGRPARTGDASEPVNPTDVVEGLAEAVSQLHDD